MRFIKQMGEQIFFFLKARSFAKREQWMPAFNAEPKKRWHSQWGSIVTEKGGRDRMGATDFSGRDRMGATDFSGERCRSDASRKTLN